MSLARGLLETLSRWIRSAKTRRGSARTSNVIDLGDFRATRGAPSPGATVVALSLVAAGAFAGVSLLFAQPPSPGDARPWVVLPPSTMRPNWEPEPWTQAYSGPVRFTILIHGVEEAGRVSDGDTLVAGRRRIRLEGIDAPERDQICEQDGRSFACGRVAAERLSAFLAGQRVVCHSASTDRFGRDLSICVRGDGADVNRHMVASGWAIAYRRYSRAYEQAEADARLRGLGLWAGSFVAPENWRAQKL